MKIFKNLILFPFITILLLWARTGNCQSDTLTKNQIDSLVRWVGFINTDLHDYDLVKKKSYLQGEQIKGLQAIARKQQSVSVRKEYKLELYSNSIIQLQAQNKAIQANLNTTTKQRNVSRIENWVWRIGAIITATKILHLW